MTSRIASIVLFAAASALSACGGNKASTLAAAGPTSCFKTSDVSAISPVNSETAILRVGARAYQLSIAGVCPDLNWNSGIVLSSETADAATLCTGQPVTVQSPSPRGGTQQCFGNELTLTQ